MARVQVSLDANLVIEVMLLAGVNNPQDAVEVVVRDYLERKSRTEAQTSNTPEGLLKAEAERRRSTEERWGGD